MASNKKNKKGKGQPVKMTPEKYIMERARKLPIGKCYINPEWKEAGLATIVISRERADGKFVVGVFLTDTYCLGVKDVIYRADADSIDFKDLLKGVFRDGAYEEISYAEAHNLIYGAIEFAEEADIEPYRDFNVAEYILEEDTDEIPLIEYDYGKDGKHLLVVGPSGKEARYMKQLKEKYGEDFDYIAPVDGMFDDTAAYDDMDEDGYYDEDEDFSDISPESQDKMFKQLLESMQKVKDHYQSDFHKMEKYSYHYPEYPKEAVLRHQFIAEALLDSNNLYSLPDSTIDEILALPADEAAEDISNLILTEIGKTYQQINAGKYEDPTDSAIMHGVLLLTHIGSREGLDALLELIRQNTEFLDYHFGDLAPEFIYPAIYACGKDDLKAIESYLYEPGYEWYARCEASRALAMIAYNHPEKRDEIIEIFRRLLKSFITRLPVQDGCDSAFAGHVMSDLIGISAKELIPEIKEVYATGYVDDMICGDAESVVRDIEEGNVLSIKEQEFEFPDILKQYAHLKSFEK